MNVYITKMNGAPWNPLQYRQWMTAEIAHGLSCREMGIFCYNGNAESEESLRIRLDGIVAGLSWGVDVVVCQFPTGNGQRFERELLNRLKVYQIRIIIFIENSEELVRESEQVRVSEWIGLYNQAEVLIIPSLAMRQFLLDNGIRKDMKFVIREMWDYTMERNFSPSPQFQREIHFTGGGGIDGINNWNYAVPLKLYADSGVQGQNVHIRSGGIQRELVSGISEGGFGLVWPQNENVRKGMEYDTSFDLARYLAAGIPVIVPVGILNQILIEKNHLGLVVESLNEAVTAVEAMEESEYQGYIQSVRRFAPALRNGYYTKKCLVDAVMTICRKDAGEIAAPARIIDSGERNFTYTVLKESYGGNLALSWSYRGKADGFLIYDTLGKLVYETRNINQHYFLIEGYSKEGGFAVKAYMDTLKGKLVVAESTSAYLYEGKCGQVKVSMIIPVYNAEDYVARCIDNVLAQSFPDLEIIVVDDGSTDHTPDIIDWYAGQYLNVIAIHQENGGPAVARNTGIKQAIGEYIGFMDCDDMIRPEMAAELYRSMKKNDCDIAITSVYRIEDSGYKEYVQYPMEEDVAIPVDDFLWMHFSKGLIFSVMVWNKLYRTSFVKERLFPELFIGEDGAWTPYILSYADKICYLNSRLYEYDRSIREKTLETQWQEHSNGERFNLYKRMVTFYLENGNPMRRGFLMELAKYNLMGWKRIYAYDEYEKLWEQMKEKYQ